jgi:glycosyltransferase involved in cell wall biosynthesis
MSMMKFDGSKIKEIRERRERGLPPTPTDGDVVVASKDAKGGSELIYERVKERVPEDLWEYFQVILSRVRDYDGRPKILWFQDTSKDPEVQFLKDKKYRDQFERFIFPSDWSLEKYHLDLGVEYEKSVVLKNSIQPIPAHTKPKDGTIRLAYISTPHRGLDLLIGAFRAMKLENVVLDVYSSFKIYGWEDQDTKYQPLYDACMNTPNVNYHGTVSNDEIRAALQQTHILAYPNIYQETACISVIEAMSAGCVVVCPNLAVLPETCANFAWMYGYVQDKNEHAKKFSYVLKDAIESFWEPPVQAGLAFQKQYFDMHYDIDTTAKQWTMMLETIKSNLEYSKQKNDNGEEIESGKKTDEDQTNS